MRFDRTRTKIALETPSVGAENNAEDKNFVFKDLARKTPLDIDLRPRRFMDFIGQDRVKRNLGVYLEAARLRDEPLDHVLLSGMPGLGKTTLSHIIAHEMGAALKITSGPAMERSGDLVGILTSLERGDILFIDEIHRLPRNVEEYLYTAMEDFCIDIVLDKGPAARGVHLEIKRFTLIGATTREGLLTAPLRSRFGVLEKLDPYPVEDLVRIVSRSMGILDVQGDDSALELIATRSRGVPRVANRLLRRIRDLVQVSGKDALDEETARKGLAMMGIDDEGLVAMDRRILETLTKSGGEPIGLKTISVTVGEEEDTIEEVYEPFLIRKGFIIKTPRGRKITPSGERHLNQGSMADARGMTQPRSPSDLRGTVGPDDGQAPLF